MHFFMLSPTRVPGFQEVIGPARGMETRVSGASIGIDSDYARDIRKFPFAAGNAPAQPKFLPLV